MIPGIHKSLPATWTSTRFDRAHDNDDVKSDSSWLPNFWNHQMGIRRYTELTKNDARTKKKKNGKKTMIFDSVISISEVVS